MPLADISCPHCGESARVNVAAVPKDSWVSEERSTVTPCRHCSGDIKVVSHTDGTHTISKKGSGLLGAAVAVVGAIVVLGAIGGSKKE